MAERLSINPEDDVAELESRSPTLGIDENTIYGTPAPLAASTQAKHINPDKRLQRYDYEILFVVVHTTCCKKAVVPIFVPK